MRTINPAISWPGGKRRLAKHILPLITPHQCYVEPFSGGLAVMLAKPRSLMEVVNDVDGDLVNFYRCVRFHSEALLIELEFVLNSREEFGDFRREPGLTDLQRAARWFYRNKICFGGSDMKSFGTGALSGGGGAHGSRASRMEAIRALSLRLDRAVIEHLSWEKCVSLYDRPSTFFFCDPPYTECGRTAYDGWTNTEVQKLRDALSALKGRWVVTLNDTPTIRAIFEGCVLLEIARPLGMGHKAGVKAKIYRELVISPEVEA